jgi:hypothetical protein
MGLLLMPAILFGFMDNAFAKKREPIPGAGWPYPWKDTYAEWKPGNIKFDEKLFDQDVIESYGWEAKSVDEIKDLIPQSLYVIMKNPDLWGPRRINVTAYIPDSGHLWEKYKQATEKFKGTVKIDDKNWIRNYQAGCPFPDPKSGIELLWNFKKRFGEDDRILGAVTIITNKRGQVRYQTSDGNLMFMDGRLTQGDKHLYKPNPNNYSRMDVYANAHPYEMQGTLSFIAQYDNPDKQDTFWLYLPALRRVRRLSAAQRTDRLPGGQDIMWENFDTFNGSPANYNCKIVGQKEMLVVHNGNPVGEWIHGKHLAGPNDFYQKVNVYINEMTPKDPNFPFSKIIHYLDPNTWAPYYSEWFDKKGQPYMFSCFQYSPGKSGIMVPACMSHVDLQTIHSTGYTVTNPKYNVGLTPAYFKIDNLKKEYPAR